MRAIYLKTLKYLHLKTIINELNFLKKATIIQLNT